MKSKTAYLHPVACPKANVDREKLARILEQDGLRIVDSPDDAYVGIVFGCAFTDDAKRETIDDVLALSSQECGHPRHLILVGCMPEKYGKELSESLPEVFAFVGNSSLAAVPAVIRKLCIPEAHGHVWSCPGADLLDSWHERMPPASAPWTRAVMVGDGCDNACTYCSIPHMRGRLRSRSVDSIMDETSFLVAQGAREIVLAGQDTACFGRDRDDPQLPALLARLAGRYPEVWTRLSYVNPDNLDDDVARVMAEYPSICNYVDLPIQHASPRILKAMGRGDRPEVLEYKIRNLRQAVPDVALRTSLILGFPGETEEDVEILKGFLKSQEFDMVGIFAFSPQPGTPAAGFPDTVPDEIVQDRILEIVAFQDEISHARMEKLVGRELEVLVEDPLESGEISARSQYDMAEVDRVIRLRDCRSAPGSFTTARIESISGPYEWTATQVHAPEPGRDS